VLPLAFCPQRLVRFLATVRLHGAEEEGVVQEAAAAVANCHTPGGSEAAGVTDQPTKDTSCRKGGEAAATERERESESEGGRERVLEAWM
jgi:hypothetical protein